MIVLVSEQGFVAFSNNKPICMGKLAKCLYQALGACLRPYIITYPCTNDKHNGEIFYQQNLEVGA